MNAVQLRNRTAKDLAAMARRKKVPGWHSMTKEELIKALLRLARRTGGRSNGSNGSKSKGGRAGGGNGRSRHPSAQQPKKRNPRLERRLQEVKARLAAEKDLTIQPLDAGEGPTRDRLVVMVRDPYWLHAYWELARRSIDRARAAMGQRWHGAQPVLRLMEVLREGSTSAVRRFVRDIPIHGGVNNWYIDVRNPPKSFQLEIGYLAVDGKFYSITRSNIVTTPPAGGGDSFDLTWTEVAKESDRIFALSSGYFDQDNSELKEVLEERLHRPMGETATSRFGPGTGSGTKRQREFNFRLDTELIVHGVTEPGARVTLRGEPVPLRPDGTFAVRFNLPDRRHVLPVVASSGDGTEQRTIVLAVDRNTKVMEPVVRDQGD